MAQLNVSVLSLYFLCSDLSLFRFDVALSGYDWQSNTNNTCLQIYAQFQPTNGATVSEEHFARHITAYVPFPLGSYETSTFDAPSSSPHLSKQNQSCDQYANNSILVGNGYWYNDPNINVRNNIPRMSIVRI